MEIAPSGFAVARYEWLNSPQEEIQGLAGRVNELIDGGILRPLRGISMLFELRLAERALDNGREGIALFWLNLFVVDVRAAIEGGNLSPEEGQSLIDTAQMLIRIIEG